MKKVKMLLEPAEVEMIRDALQLSYDDNSFDDENDILEGLCQAFAILAMSGNFVKVAVDEETCYTDENNCCCSEIEIPERIQVDDDDNVPDDIDPDNSCWDANEDRNGFCGNCGCSHCECDNEDQVGCGVTRQDLENAWNANEPWNTNKK